MEFLSFNYRTAALPLAGLHNDGHRLSTERLALWFPFRSSRTMFQKFHKGGTRQHFPIPDLSQVTGRNSASGTESKLTVLAQARTIQLKSVIELRVLR